MTILVRTAGLFLVTVVALGACGPGGRTEAPSPDADESPTSAPADRSEPTRNPDPPSGSRLMPLDGTEPAVRWTANGFEVRAFGSSSCPPLATGVEVVDSTTAVIDIEPQGGGACTDDLAPHNSVVPTPEELDRDEPLVVRLRDATGLSAPIRVRFLDNTAM